MSTEIQPRDHADAIERAVVEGDLSLLGPAERLSYYRARCESAGLDPLARPFDYLKLNGKVVLYANKSATDQLVAKHALSVSTSFAPDPPDGTCVVVARVTRRDGTYVEDCGAVPIAGLRGEPLCNAIMKTVTKSKRRAVLSACGLGLSDESEIESIPGAERVPLEAPPVREHPESFTDFVRRSIEAEALAAGARSGDAWEAPPVTIREVCGELSAFLGFGTPDDPDFDAEASRRAIKNAWSNDRETVAGQVARICGQLLREGLPCDS